MKLPVRYGPVFSAARILRLPVPLNDPIGETIVIHGVDVDAVHEHPDWVLTVTRASPPPGPSSTLDWLR
jgi:hypothetical protein